MKTDPLIFLKRIEAYGFRIKLIDEAKKRISFLQPEKLVEMCVKSKNGKGFVNLFLEK